MSGKDWRAFGKSGCLHQNSFEHWIGVSLLQSDVHIQGSVLLPNTKYILHSRNAANQRFSSKDSLKVIGNILLQWWANREQEQKELSPVDIVNPCPSPAVAPARRSPCHSSTPQVRMSCVQGISGKTSGRGSNMANLPSEFVERCINYDGFYPSVKYDPSKKEQRVACSVCKRKTPQFCWKCRRPLFNEVPLKGVGRDDTKYQKHFSVKVPVLKTRL